jgi:hypothetical protein
LNACIEEGRQQKKKKNTQMYKEEQNIEAIHFVA